MATTGRSFTWDCNATVQYVAANLTRGDQYTPVVGMSLKGDDYEGWQNPVTLEIQTPESPNVLFNAVNCIGIPLGDFGDFSFPSFTLTRPIGNINNMITLTAKTTQEANLNSMLIFSNTIKMAEGQHTGPLAILSSLQFSTKYDVAALTPGSKYRFAFPLMLKGESTEGWKEPVTLEVVLPNGENYPTTTVDPSNIPLSKNSYKNFMSGLFSVNKSDGVITLNVITNQGRNIKSALVVGDVKLMP